MNKYKKALIHRLLIQVEELTDTTELHNVDRILATTFKDAMQKDDFTFCRYDDFTDDLKRIMDGGGKVFITRYRHKPVATIAMEVDTIDKWYHTGDIVIMRHLAVDPAYQSMGLGKLMLGTVMHEAEALGLPITFSTPEGNVSTVRFYERMGADKIRFFRADDHYAVRFLMHDHSSCSAEQCRKVYENSAISCLMKSRDIDATPADSTIAEMWKNDFARYFGTEYDKRAQSMRRAFLRYGITPKEYKKYHFFDQNAENKGKYISAMTADALYKEYKKAYPTGQRLDKKAFAADGTGAISFADGYDCNVRIVTVNGGTGAEPLFALLDIRSKSGDVTGHADVDIATGRIGDISIPGCKLSIDTLPDIGWLVELTTNAATPMRNGILGWDAVYTDGGWCITRVVTRPSFSAAQVAKKRGIKPDMERIIGHPIDTALQT